VKYKHNKQPETRQNSSVKQYSTPHRTQNAYPGSTPVIMKRKYPSKNKGAAYTIPNPFYSHPQGMSSTNAQIYQSFTGIFSKRNKNLRAFCTRRNVLSLTLTLSQTEITENTQCHQKQCRNQLCPIRRSHKNRRWAVGSADDADTQCLCVHKHHNLSF